MKKDHPHPFPSPSIQEIIALYEKAAAEVTSPESLYKEAPSQSKRLSSIPEKDEERQSLLKEETVHASTNATMPLTRGGSTKRQQQPETTHTTVTSQVTQRAIRVLSEEEIILLLPHHSLVRTYQEEIQRLSAKAYGNPDILQEKMQEIQKNPAAGKELSWRMAAHPESIAKLSGTSTLGFKNRTRKQAEEDFSTLCVTVDCYTKAVKQARESLLQSPEQELKNYERLMGKAAVTELLQKPDQREKETLSEAEISTKIQQHSKVKRHYAQIKYWCEVVFGNANILQSQVETLFQSPEAIETLAQQLVGNPQSFHKYAGISLCGFKNQARRHAEAGLSHLIDAADNYATAVTQVRESILQTEQAKQKRHEPSSKQTQDLHQQQRLSQSVGRTEHSTVTHEEATTSTQQRETDIRLRKTVISKEMAFAN
ncbi:BID domain-containing T4SS effector [Bartonella grahamii]|uniref:Protein involved in cell division n=2 Tax=Bartonella grahamii TaxID=33045 RepID=A0A336NE42_BARGR|nr:BID domain-containing T4SS effector [Bartonella grahamii]ACS51685.1 BepE protein [Bartonella grahamii as4aup]SSZ39187.1 Protein involved in cell division [Bartonella grahamii]